MFCCPSRSSSARSSASASATRSLPRRRRGCGWAGCRRSVIRRRTASSSSSKARRKSCTSFFAGMPNSAVRVRGAKPFARGALYLMLQNRIYRGEIVHKEQSHPGGHPPIIDQPLWDAVQAQLASNAAERNSGALSRQPSLLAGMLFDRDGTRMTPSHAVKKATRYRYYVSGSLITKDRTEDSAGLRIPAAEIEHLVSSRVHR